MRGISVAIVLFLLSASSIVAFAQQPERNSNLQIADKPDTKTVNVKDLKHTIISPHLKQPIPKGTNVLWCNTFQLAWNELCDLAGGPIEMEDSPAMVSILNNRNASKNDLDKKSYIALAGLASEGIYERIEKELQDKFKGQATPRLFEAVRKLRHAWVTYAYLFKQLPFQWSFDRFHGHLKFKGKAVDSFGIDQLLNDEEDEAMMATQVSILDYQDSNSFIIELKTRSNDDRLILAKIPPKITLEETIAAVEGRISGKKPMQMEEMTDLHVPVLDFDLLREYSELYDKVIHANKLGDTRIEIALQSIRFRLDETGAVLKSEAIGAGGIVPRNLVFDKPFLVLLKCREAKRPYFVLWVANAELLVSTPNAVSSPSNTKPNHTTNPKEPNPD